MQANRLTSSDILLIICIAYCQIVLKCCDAAARLPTHLTPISYDVRLLPHVDPAFDWEILGHVRISLRCEESGSNNVTVHALEIGGIGVDTVEVRKGGVTVNVTEVYLDPGNDFLIITLGEELTAGEDISVEISPFKATLNDKLLGFYRSKYLHEGTERWMGITQFQTGHARKAFPCLDEPGLKAEFRVTLGRLDSDGWMTLSNMPRLETVPIEGRPGYVWDIYQPTPNMSTYLVAFCVAQFEFVQSSTDPRVKVWSRPDVLHKAKFAAAEGGKLLRIFEEELDIPYALPKVDLIAITDFYYGAMENWGLVTFKEDYLVLDHENKTSTAKETLDVISILAHELAHQWFGNLVTPQWWNDLWLSEGFSCYFDYVATQKVRPHWNLMDAYFTVFETQDDLRTDAVLATANPVYTDIDDHSNVGKLKVCKGSPLLHMLRRQLGESTFRKAVRNYLKANKFSLVHTEELFEFFQMAAEEDGVLIPAGHTIKDFMSGWVTQRGSPLVTLTRHENGTATVQQKRFFLSNEEDAAGDPNYTWFIGMNFNVAAQDFNQTFAQTWLTSENPSGTLHDQDLPSGLDSWAIDESKGNWVIVNAKQTGFYRVNYDVRNWAMIVEQLLDDHTTIAAENRAQVLDDAFNLALSQDLDFPLVLSLTSYLAMEDELGPWAVAKRIWDFLDLKLRGVNGVDALLKDYARCLLGPQYSTLLTLDEVPASYDEIDAVAVFKQVLVQEYACKYGWQPCREEAHEQYRRWMDSYDQQEEPNSDTLNPNIKSVIFCNGLNAASSDAAWDHAWKYYLDTTSEKERKMVVVALACTEDEALINRYLEQIFDQNSTMLAQHKALAFRSIVEHSVLGTNLAFKDLVDNFELILTNNSSSSDGSLGEFIKPFATCANDEIAQQLTELKETHEGNLGGAETVFDQTIKTIKENSRWVNENNQGIAQWLESALNATGCSRQNSKNAHGKYSLFSQRLF